VFLKRPTILCLPTGLDSARLVFCNALE